jgi:hypothetical protein
MLSDSGQSTLFLGTHGGGFAWMTVDSLLMMRLSDAASAILRYGFKSICVEDFGAIQFPTLERVERTIHVDGSAFWIEAWVPVTNEKDRTVSVPIRTLRQAICSRNDTLFFFPNGAEHVLRQYLDGMSVAQRDCLFGSDVADRLAVEYKLQKLESMHG